MSEPQTAANRRVATARARSTLLAHVRHELRTPINAILNYSEMLIEDAPGIGRDDLLADLRKIHSSGKHLLALVNEILDPTVIEQGKLDLDLEAFGGRIRNQLRNPLNVIINYCEMLIEDVGDASASFSADLRNVHKAGRKLLALSEDIVSFSKREASDDIDIDAATSGVFNMIRGVVEEIEPALAHESAASASGGRVLVVDDNELNRDVLSRRLERNGHTVVTAENGLEALRKIAEESFDLVLLDVMMPEMNGYQLLRRLKGDPRSREIPVIIISALGEVDSVVRCITMGAEDYLPKPFNPVLLKARVDASLEKKRLRDQEQAYLAQLRAEREKSEGLLLNILPGAVVEKLKSGQHFIAERFEEATVLFADLVGFTEWSNHTQPVELVYNLNELFSLFDGLTERHGLEKIKTIGDCYMVAGGIPTRRDDHARAVAEMALDVNDEVARFNALTGFALNVRIGIHTGPVVAGIIGTRKFIYDLWGDTVNIASRMESHSIPGRIQVSGETYSLLKDKYLFEDRGTIEVKSKGTMTTYFLNGRRA